VTLRRKLAVTTIAASVAMSAFAGIPLSNKGLAEKLGVSNVAYAATSSYDLFVTEAKKIYGALKTVSGGVKAVNDFRSEIDLAIETDNKIIAPLVNKLSDDSQVRTDVSDLIQELLGIQIGDDWETRYEAIRQSNAGLLDEIYPELSSDDLAGVFLKLERSVATVLSNAKLSDLNPPSAAIKTKLKNAAQTAIDSNAKVKKLFEAKGVSSSDLADVYAKLQESEHVKFGTASLAFMALQSAYNKAYPPSTGGGGGEVGPIVELTSEAQNLINSLIDLKAKLATATEEEKAKLIEEATKQVDELVKKLAVITVKVDVVDGKATVVLDETNTVIALNSISAVIARLLDATGVSYAAPKLSANAGEVTENEVAVKLSAKVVEAAINAKVPAISLKVGEFGVELPFGGTFSKQIDFGFKKSDANEAALGGLKAASQVYDFSLSVGGVATTSFDRPIVISIPLGSTTGLDKELLSVAKIVEGGLEFHGGRVTNTSVIESRDSFSSYVVVENKVTFGDIAHVSSWAGRAIEVVAAKGAINGKAEGVFDPNANVTRAEFAKMLVRALDLENGSATEGFADVNTSDWFAPYVAAAAEKGIIKGKTATKFDPSAPIKRAEMATMITRALQLVNGSKDVANIDAALAVFSDAAQINETLKAGVAFAASKEIVVGSDGKFAPNANATRAQAAVIIYRAINAN